MDMRVLLEVVGGMNLEENHGDLFMRCHFLCSNGSCSPSFDVKFGEKIEANLVCRKSTEPFKDACLVIGLRRKEHSGLLEFGKSKNVGNVMVGLEALLHSSPPKLDGWFPLGSSARACKVHDCSEELGNDVPVLHIVLSIRNRNGAAAGFNKKVCVPVTKKERVAVGSSLTHTVWGNIAAADFLLAARGNMASYNPLEWGI